MSDTPEELRFADSLWPADLVQLADVEARSRADAGVAWNEAFLEWDAIVGQTPKRKAVFREARRIALRLFPDEDRERLVAETLMIVVLSRPPVSADSRMYLGRGWRRWRNALASS